jgi:hypothetical protein
MNQNKIHLVPQTIIDSGESILNSKVSQLKLTHIQRLEAVREYCDAILKKVEQVNDKGKR